jgi:hypothetical protein
MSSSLIGYMNERDQLDAEIKRLSARLKDLRRKRDTAESHIIEYLKSNDLPGGKLRGKEIRLITKQQRARKGAKDKEADAIDVLRNYGIRDPHILLEELQNAQKGKEIEKCKLKITSSIKDNSF